MESNRILLNYPSLQYSHSASAIPNEEKFEVHCHGTYELIYILQGEGKHIIEGTEYQLHPHTLFLMRPYEYHYICPDRNRAYERVVLYFDDASLPATIKESPLLQESGGRCFSIGSHGNPIRAAFDALSGIAALSQNGTACTPESEALLRATIAQIVLLLAHEEPRHPLSEESGVVHRVIDHLNNHLCEDFCLDAIAKEFFISKYHLCRIFHRQTGASIFHYFTTKRIALARQMIADGESATSVAIRLGFRDYSTFYRAYRKQTGDSPVRRLK
jgi:AraC-like DNA-binding protein